MISPDLDLIDVDASILNLFAGGAITQDMNTFKAATL
jgi:hypothetical protein